MHSKSQIDLDPREIDAFVCGMSPRQELVHRLAVRDVCDRCRGDRLFMKRTDALIFEFRKNLSAVLREANQLSAELMASVDDEGRSAKAP